MNQQPILHDQIHEHTISPLRQLYFYLTEGCNMACRHCWLAPKFDADGSRYAVLPVEAFETAIHEAIPLGLRGVKLTGGEPLLHPEFTRLLSIVRQHELALAIETNGVRCTPEIAAEIAKSPRRSVSVSIDGADAETHEWVRGVPGAFDLATQAVRYLEAAGVPPQIIMSVMPHNAHQIDAVVRMAEVLGASSVKFNVVQPTARGERLHQSDGALDVAQLIALGRHVERVLTRSTNLKLYFDYPLAFRPLSRIAGGRAAGTCGIFGILGVISSGRYALCGIGEQVPALMFGVVGEDRLANVWHQNAALTTLREGLPARLEGVCAECLMKYHCLASCVAQNYYRTGDFFAPFWFCEQAYESGLFPESRLQSTRY
jgi:SynChlorMet cassette radical SAM/SPASM protein ScmF